MATKPLIYLVIQKKPFKSSLTKLDLNGF